MRARRSPLTPRRKVGNGSTGGGAERVRRSSGSGPCIRLKGGAASSTERVVGPGVSSDGASGRMPWQLTRPIVVLRPVMPHHDAGSRTEPPVSVPIAHGAIALATATPEPLLDPPGVRAIAVSHGFHGVPM